MPFFDPIRIGASGSAEGYTIDRSLRLNSEDNTFLQRTPSSTTSRTTWTFSLWIKRCKFDSTMGLFGTSGSDNNTLTEFLFTSANRFSWSASSKVYFTTEQRFRDPTAWFHLLVRCDTTNSTQADRQQLWINGERVTDFDAQNLTGSGTEFGINRNVDHRLGERPSGGDNFDAYLAEVNFIDGIALDSTSFTETNALTGELVPKKYIGSYGTNGFYLKFADNTNNAALGTDSSGNGNTFTVNNIASSHDTVTDTPTNNFPTFNPLNKTNDAVLSDGNIVFVQSSNDESVTGTFPILSGKWYWEVYKKSTENPELGIEVLTRPLSNKTDDVSPTKVCFRTNGGDQQVGTGSPTSITGSSGGQTGAGVIAIAVDFDNKKIWYSDLSGNFFNSGNPATGSNAAFDFSSVAVADGCVPYFFCGTGANDAIFVNFGQDGTHSGNVSLTGNTDANGHGSFKYSVPSGYLALCSANLPDPTIALPDNHFDIILYTGSGSSSLNNITGLEFQPDWVWGNARNDTIGNILFDAVRGDDKQLSTDITAAEVTRGSAAYRFLSNGFAVSNVGNLNNSSVNYVAWCWFAGGSTVTNSSGTISSQVRANTTAGFSIVSYTGNGSSGATVGHGLGVVPDQIIIRRREGDNWMYYSHSLNNGSSPQNFYLELNEAGGQINDSRMMNNTAPTSTVFSLRNDTSTNGNSATYIAYCFSEVIGYSKFGRYTGNGNSNGTFVMTGFRPAFVIIKCRSASEHWRIFDYKRSPINQVNRHLFVNNENQESTETGLDFVANGFKFRDGDTHQNGNNEEYIYWAFAESPLKTSRAR